MYLFLPAYHMAGDAATAMRVFTVLVGNAVAEERFIDAAYLHHLLASQNLESAMNNEKLVICIIFFFHLFFLLHVYNDAFTCLTRLGKLRQTQTWLGLQELAVDSFSVCQNQKKLAANGLRKLASACGVLTSFRSVIVWACQVLSSMKIQNKI